MKKRKIRERQKRRKNFLPTLIITLALWSSLLLLVYFVDPVDFGAIFLFFVIVFFCCIFTLSIIFASASRGILYSISLIIFLSLSYFGIGNVLNFFLLLAVSITIDLYLHKE